MQQVVIGIAIVERTLTDGQRKFLVGTRDGSQTLAGFDEFPGGKVADGETPSEAAVRECEEESGLTVEVVEPLVCTEHSYDHGAVELHFFLCRPVDVETSTPRLPFRWVSRHELAGCNFPAANDAVLRLLARP